MSNCVIFSGGTHNPDDWAIFSRTLGPYRLASSLEDAGYTTFVLDFIEHFNTDEIIKVLSNHIGEDTLWVGFSSTFYWPKFDERTHELSTNDADATLNGNISEMYYDTSHDEIKRVMDYVREHSSAKFIYGGAKSPYFAIRKLDSENIDYYVTGNADNSIIDITDYLAGKKDTIEHIEDKVVHSNKYKEPDVNNIPTRWWKKEYNVLPNEGLPIELARGCIFKCKFCSFPLLGKKKGTYTRDGQQVKDELIKIYETYGTESYIITDDTFNDDNDKLEILHNVFTSLPFKPKFSSYLRVDLINRFPHQIDLLTEMGLVGAFFGLETMDPDSAKAIGKGLHPNKVKDCLYRIHDKWKNKVNVEAGFILGLPYDRLSYFHDLTSWCLEEDNPLQAIRFYPLRLFKYDNHETFNIETSEFSANPEIYGYEFNNTIHAWTLPSQKLSFTLCQDIGMRLNNLVRNRNKISSFQVIQALNVGVPLSDILTMTELDIVKKYDIATMKSHKVNQYKKLVGL